MKNCLKKIVDFIEGHPKTADCILTAAYFAVFGTGVVLIYDHYEKKRTENEDKRQRELLDLND